MTTPIAVIGAGAWGTTLAMILAHQGHTVRLWEYFPEYARVLDQTRENPKFLPGIRISEAIAITSDLNEAAAGCAEIVLAAPTQKLRGVAQQLARMPRPANLVVTASKGIEHDSLLRVSEILAELFKPDTAVCALSGPSHAEEVSRRLPCSLVAASVRAAAAARVQELFMTEWVRIYTSPDIVGVELGGALKNIIAIAAGVVDGLGLGDNAKAALVTRGLVEMRRMGLALGARPETFAGLAGLGDLITTCMSRHSRNRRVGEELGRGKKLPDILAAMEMVAEGVETARSAKRLAERLGVDMPITQQVNRILFEGLQPAAAVAQLMQRARKSEIEPEV